MSISSFLEKHYRHFNAAACIDAAKGWVDLINNGGKMLVTLAGAMSTAELGISLSELIRQDLVHGICCTGANLEEDFFNLVAHDSYLRIPEYRTLSKKEEMDLYNNGLNRVTDTCIPEEIAIQKIGKHLLALWKKAEQENKRYFPHEYFFQLFESKVLEEEYQIDLKDSWLYAAYEKKLPIFTPGYEDSSTGNIFVANVMKKELNNITTIKSGFEQMQHVVKWYRENNSIGFFQVGGGIAGDFPICAVPLIRQDLQEINSPLWAYFCQISDSTTSYGSYSGAVPNEKITWGKLDENTPSFIIESDATIVAPLVFQYVLEKALTGVKKTLAEVSSHKE
ncbi:MAG: deoxyhypusine synthase family protein [Chlamydiota bacterium]|jgi:deoxyhypusine synthase